MKDIYNYIPETNHVSRVFSVAIILYLPFISHVILFHLFNVLYIYISTFRSMCAVQSTLGTSRLYPRKCSWYSFLLEAELTPGP